MVHLLPRVHLSNTDTTTQLLIMHAFQLHSLPNHLTTDWGSQLTSRFWKETFHLLDVRSHTSTSHQPQTAGQSKQVNQVLEQYLHCFLNQCQNHYIALLPLAEFTYNNAKHASTKFSPFYSKYGFHPWLHPSVPHHLWQFLLPQIWYSLFIRS